jgi:hypothetical protein
MVLIISGLALGIASQVLDALWKHRYHSTNWWLVLSLYGVGLLLFGFGNFLSWRGRQYAAQADAERILTDSKRDVLYLRAFRSDPATLWSREGGPKTPEEQLANVLRPFGNLVAIGRPGEELPPPGAARIYTSDEEWKEIVTRQMQAARLVIIRAAVGENLFWELKQAVATLCPQKVLILVLKMKAKPYECFRTDVNPMLSVSLPDAAMVRPRFGRVSGFIAFAPDWKPSFLRLRASYFRSGFYTAYLSSFKYALRPVFESFGLEWQPPPLRLVEKVLLPMAWILFVGLLVSLKLH